MTNPNRMHLLAEHAALERLIADTPEDEVLDRGSMSARLEELEQRIAKAGADEREPARVRLTFRGSPVVGSHGIFAEFGSKAVSTFAESVAAMAASMAGPLAPMGPIPNREQHQMLITSTALGSFGFELEEHRTGQLTLEDASPVAQALERTQRLLQGTLGSDEELADSAFEADERALDKVRAFLQTLSDNDAWCAMEVGGDLVTFASADQVRTSLARLSHDNIREEEQTLTGELRGALPDGRVFEFKLAEDGLVIRGKVGPTIQDAEDLNRHLRQPASIQVKVRRVGNGRPRYVLLQLTETKK